jgi:hypothetical protein
VNNQVQYLRLNPWPCSAVLQVLPAQALRQSSAWPCTTQTSSAEEVQPTPSYTLHTSPRPLWIFLQAAHTQPAATIETSNSSSTMSAFCCSCWEPRAHQTLSSVLCSRMQQSPLFWAVAALLLLLTSSLQATSSCSLHHHNWPLQTHCTHVCRQFHTSTAAHVTPLLCPFALMALGFAEFCQIPPNHCQLPPGPSAPSSRHLLGAPRLWYHVASWGNF